LNQAGEQLDAVAKRQSGDAAVPDARTAHGTRE
jgi:hypothetical protein